jgi:large subunit ribosomal protein L28
MARTCQICGKQASRGNRVSFSHRRTRRSWKPNLQTVRAVVNGRPERVTVCVACLKAGKVTKRVPS